jgi:hypothetical protein
MIHSNDNKIADPNAQRKENIEPQDNRIILPSGPMSISESAKRMFRIIAKHKKLYLYGDRVVEIARSNSDKIPVLTPVDGQSFRSRIEHYGPVMAYRVGSHQELLLKPDAKCSMDIALALLASQEKSLLPPIALIHNCPIFTREGIIGSGYHPLSGGRLIKGGLMPPEMTLRKAVRLLLEVIAEFSFLEPSDKSRAISVILSPAFKPGELLKTHFPLFVFEADESQAGKGYFLEVVQALYREFASFVTQRKGGVGSFDESISQKLIDGRIFIQIDNVRGELNSQLFEAILTCPYGGTVPARIPHKGEVQIRPDRFIFQLTSNGFVSTRDLANRSCIVRIRKRRGFAFKRYAEGDLLSHVTANQPLFLGAIYRVLSEWCHRGMPATNDLRAEGRIRQWSQHLDWIIQHIFSLPPLMDGHTAAQERVSNPALDWLRAICLAVEDDRRLGQQLSATDLLYISQDHSISIPGLAEDAHEVKSKIHIGHMLSKIFGEYNIYEGDGFVIRKTEKPRYETSSGKDITIKNYEIKRAEQGTLF